MFVQPQKTTYLESFARLGRCLLGNRSIFWRTTQLANRLYFTVSMRFPKFRNIKMAFHNLDCVHTIPAHFENGRKFDSKNSLQDFDAKEKYLHPKNRPVSIQKRRKMFCLHHYRVFTRCCLKSRPVRVPFSNSTVFEICRQKMCRFRVNGRPIRHIFHRFQNVPASCERSLRNTFYSF